MAFLVRQPINITYNTYHLLPVDFLIGISYYNLETLKWKEQMGWESK